MLTLKKLVLPLLLAVLLAGCSNTDTSDIVLLRGTSIDSLVLESDFMESVETPFLYKNESLKTDLTFLNLFGSFSVVGMPYNNGNLAMEYLPIMVLQSFAKTDLSKPNSRIAVCDKDFNSVEEYTYDELKKFVVYENDEIAVFDMLELMTGKTYEDYLEAMESHPVYSRIYTGEVSVPIDEPYISDGKISFDWMGEVRDHVVFRIDPQT